MLKDCDWSIDRDYKTGSENEPLQFYLDGLANSKEFSLLLGYFSSSAINLLSVGFATFISKGGKMRMVINHLLSAKDKEAIEKASQESINKVFDLTDVVSLGRVLDEYDTHFFECLAYLIAEKRIEIKVIKPKNGKGIAHYKSGVFSDGENRVGYKASCNFTLYGLSENLEELEAFLSWENGRSNKLINKQLKLIDDYFSERDEDVEYVQVSDIEVVLKDKFGKKDLNELLVQEEELLRKKQSLVLSNPKLKKTISKLFEEIELTRQTPKFPYPEGPREYQKVAFENWKKNKQQGLFAMATGTGKTITSLNCLLEVYKKTGYYKALIIVPTITLVNQWEKECKKFKFTDIVKISSKSNWQNDFASILTRERLSPTQQVSFIVISTYASFARKNIFPELNKLSVKTLLIADECHNLGSRTLLKLLPNINFGRRIGLSATPERQFDEEGNKKLFSFFNCENSYTYEYSMKDAINNGVLCRYYYYPHLVSLTESEMKDYMELSVKISKFYKSDTDSFNNSPILTALLLARKRIIHKAINKLSIFYEILNSQFKKYNNLKYTLVYAPEGYSPSDYIETDFFLDNEDLESENDESHLIDSYTQKVIEINKKITVKQFVSGTNEKENILDQFANGEIDVLTSMKCLDEGVDVPRAELAIFCSSTGNPRQFIQRRGRILRKHSEKQYATIHDLVVIPKINRSSETYKMERSMLKKELERVNNFALLSENSSYSINILLETMNYYNLNLYHNE